MSEYRVIPGRGRVRVDNSFGGALFIGSSDNRRRESAYDRTKAQVYATGNKWAIENFHATHD